MQHKQSGWSFFEQSAGEKADKVEGTLGVGFTSNVRWRGIWTRGRSEPAKAREKGQADTKGAEAEHVVIDSSWLVDWGADDWGRIGHWRAGSQGKNGVRTEKAVAR